jgi:hypothetical protein
LCERYARDRSAGDGGAGRADVAPSSDVTTAANVATPSDVTTAANVATAAWIADHADVCGAGGAYRAAGTDTAEYARRRGAWQAVMWNS